MSFDFSYRVFMRAAALFTNDVGAIYYSLYLAGIATMFAAAAYASQSLRFGHLLSIAGAVGSKSVTPTNWCQFDEAIPTDESCSSGAR
ncbi:hypothetical protein JQ543_21275 [Bradyrhizobium diazoefficiens]|nr:hypothetical protein [Bradyrhizobium diazoefficiens]MBR0850290.1 hypothetical protein [Bradyrhizobium diazoefficiens]